MMTRVTSGVTNIQASALLPLTSGLKDEVTCRVRSVLFLKQYSHFSASEAWWRIGSF